MTRNGKILAGAAVILTLGSAAAVAHKHGGWHHKGPHGWSGAMGMMGSGGPLCRGNAAEKADLMLVRLEYKVKPTDAQKPAFDDLKTAVKSAAAKVAAACPPAQDRAAAPGQNGKPSKDITARLADTEAQLSAALDGIKIVRPAAEKLYAALDDAQKKAISDMGRRGKWGRHDGRSERHGERGSDGQRGGPVQGPASDDGARERKGEL